MKKVYPYDSANRTEGSYNSGFFIYLNVVTFISHWKQNDVDKSSASRAI